MRKTIISIIILIFFVGCAPKTTVLLIDNGKVQNAIIVSTNKASKRLDKVGTFVNLNNINEPPSETKIMSKEEINNRYVALFKVAPQKPKTYIVYFKKNSTELTEESEKILDKALKTIQKRSPCMVDVIGHTDTVGSNKLNAKVSLKRANYVKRMIEKRRIKIVSLIAKGYGEEDLLMKTANNVSESRNRNVEIFIK